MDCCFYPIDVIGRKKEAVTVDGHQLAQPIVVESALIEPFLQGRANPSCVNRAGQVGESQLLVRLLVGRLALKRVALAQPRVDCGDVMGGAFQLFVTFAAISRPRG